MKNRERSMLQNHQSGHPWTQREWQRLQSIQIYIAPPWEAEQKDKVCRALASISFKLKKEEVKSTIKINLKYYFIIVIFVN